MGKESIEQKSLERNEAEILVIEENNKSNKDKLEEKFIETMNRAENEQQINEEEDISEQNKKRNISKKTIIGIGIIIFAILICSTVFALLNMKESNIVSGIKIKGIEVSGLSAEEAKVKLENIYNEKKEKEIQIKYEDYESSINPNMLETKYKIDEAVSEAISIGRSSNIFVNNYEIILSLLGKKDIDIDMEINEEIATKTVEDIGTNLPGTLVDSAYYIEDNKLFITKGQEGIKIDTEELLERIKENLNQIQITNEYITIPIINEKPEEIDIDKIHNEVYKEVQDAHYTKEPFTIYPEVEGVDFDVEAAKKMLEEDKHEYVIDLIITKPKITTSQIGTEAFPDQLATFKTNYDGGNKDRTTNLQLACEKINGKVILAGDTFSYNQTLGARTATAGYKNAKVYENGEVVDGIGGGICQISSTLYNAVLRANLEILERKNHQFVTSYVEAGMDATVVYGMTDFKFKNTRKYPIKIMASAKSGVATVTLYGIKEEPEYTFSFKTVTVSTIPTTTKYVEDSTLQVGTEKVKQKGANGKKTETYITKMLNGKVISTKLLSKDTYDAMKTIIIRGTKGAETKTIDKTNNVNTNNNTNANSNTNIQNNTNTSEVTNSSNTNHSNDTNNNTNEDVKDNNIN